MKRRYIKISKGFAESNNKKKRGLNAFSYGVTINNEYFCSENLLETHPDLFDNMTIEYIWVGQNDLPVADDLITPTRSRIKTSEVTEDNKEITTVKLPWYKRLWNWVVKQYNKLF